MKKYTAIETLHQRVKILLDLKIKKEDRDLLDFFFEQSKKIEKQQISDAWVDAWMESMINPLDKSKYEDLGNEYFDENFFNLKL
jgi:hypothetical protein